MSKKTTLATLLIMVLCQSCIHTYAPYCRHIALSQYVAAADDWNDLRAGVCKPQLWELVNEKGDRHGAVRLSKGGKWYWVDQQANIFYTLSDEPLNGYTPVKQVTIDHAVHKWSSIK